MIYLRLAVKYMGIVHFCSLWGVSSGGALNNNNNNASNTNNYSARADW